MSSIECTKVSLTFSWWRWNYIESSGDMWQQRKSHASKTPPLQWIKLIRSRWCILCVPHFSLVISYFIIDPLFQSAQGCLICAASTATISASTLGGIRIYNNHKSCIAHACTCIQLFNKFYLHMTNRIFPVRNYLYKSKVNWLQVTRY